MVCSIDATIEYSVPASLSVVKLNISAFLIRININIFNCKLRHRARNLNNIRSISLNCCRISKEHFNLSYIIISFIIIEACQLDITTECLCHLLSVHSEGQADCAPLISIDGTHHLYIHARGSNRSLRSVLIESNSIGNGYFKSNVILNRNTSRHKLKFTCGDGDSKDCAYFKIVSGLNFHRTKSKILILRDSNIFLRIKCTYDGTICINTEIAICCFIPIRVRNYTIFNHGNAFW